MKTSTIIHCLFIHWSTKLTNVKRTRVDDECKEEEKVREREKEREDKKQNPHPLFSQGENEKNLGQPLHTRR